MSVKGPNRRMVLGGIGGTLIMPAILNAQTASDPVVTTRAGRVRGYRGDGVTIFKGMRYGADTAATGRFKPPQPVEPWDGVFDATEYGPQSPQVRSFLADPGPMSEDCLRINVWTPATDGARRPVMLWFHGGGFEAGSGSSPLYEGTRLAQRGDVVVATINHRLNVVGHCHLADRLGAEYASSGNAGFLDLVMAMRWVRENIEAFGGDPDNVTIFGQSGGGRKVSLSYASPVSQDLFTRGIVQSGSHLLVQTPEQANNLTGKLIAQLGLGDAQGLLTVPVEELIAAQRSVIEEEGYRFEPVMDGIVFPAQPWLPQPPAGSANKPMMLGSTRTELSATLGLMNPRLFDLTEATLPVAVGRFVGADKAAEAIEIFRESRPEAPPPEIFFTIVSARAYGLDSTIMAEQRVRGDGNGDTYLYRLAWRSPAEGGRRVTPHSLDLPFIFDNVETESGARLAGPPTDATAAMVDQMSATWIAYARTGDPNHAGLPDWAPYDLESRPTMVFDLPPHAENDPWAGEREFMAQFETQQTQRGRYRSAISE